MKPLKSFEGAYDIPMDDLKRTVQLAPEEIMRWLEGIINLTCQVTARKSIKAKYRPKKQPSHPR